MNYPEKRESTHDRAVAIMYILFARSQAVPTHIISAVLDLTPRRVNAILRGLEDNGFVYRQVDTSDSASRWRYASVLTDVGRQWVLDNRGAASETYRRQEYAAHERRMARQIARYGGARLYD